MVPAPISTLFLQLKTNLVRLRDAVRDAPPGSLPVVLALAAFDALAAACFALVALSFLADKPLVIAAGAVVLLGGLVVLNYLWLTRRRGEAYVALPAGDALAPTGRFDARSVPDGLATPPADEEDDDAPPALADPLHLPADRTATLGGRWLLRAPLGEGRFALVRLAVDLPTGIEAACKTVPLHGPRSAGARASLFAFREAACLAAVGEHPNIAGMLDCVIAPDAVHIVLAKAQGKELFEVLDAAPDGVLPEAEARRVATDVLLALAHVHSKGILHRDVKLDNIMYEPASGDADAPDRPGKATLIDFGLATFCAPRVPVDDPTSAVAYSSPAVLALRADGDPYFFDRGHADLWSFGVCVHAMLTSRFPRSSSESDPAALLNSLLREPYTPPSTVSPDAASFLTNILDPLSRGRISAASLLRHPWIAYPDPPAEPPAVWEAKEGLAGGDWRAQAGACRLAVEAWIAAREKAGER
ncbi:kinase-like domain-containing protein [Hyaloraphidium curvatum]|nr:kinase-like domain-containing protein [Hyaloraphidium curvatum]